MKENDYVKRLTESVLAKKLNSCGCVVVSGPKFCGKSTMCERFANSIIALKTTNEIALANLDPREVLKGEKPRLIDEWQKAPELWNLIRDDLDRNYIFGKYLLTGSTTPVDSSKIQHSGAGRITTMILKPFTLFESGESQGLVSLLSLFKASNKFKTIFNEGNNVGLSDIAHYICRGGWPISLKANKDYAINVTENYFNGLFTIENESDEFSEFLKNKDIELLKLVLKSFARNISTQTKNTKMISDILESGVRKTLDDDTFLKYKKILEDLFIIYEMPSWNLNLRSTVNVRTSPTHHFIDTSIATSALGLKPSDLLNDLKSFGFFFEDMVVRDLSVYAGTFDGVLRHYRDSNGQEVDAIIEIPNGDYCAIEIKLFSEENVKKAIKSLNSFENKIIQSNLKKPKFKMIITSHGPSYKTEDEIYVVPITMLKP